MKQEEYAYNMSEEEMREAGLDEKNLFSFMFAKENIQHLEGRMLTIIDAVIADKEQRKSVKDLVRNEFGNKYDWLWEAAYMVNVNTDYEHSIIPIKQKIKQFDGVAPSRPDGFNAAGIERLTSIVRENTQAFSIEEHEGRVKTGL